MDKNDWKKIKIGLAICFAGSLFSAFFVLFYDKTQEISNAAPKSYVDRAIKESETRTSGMIIAVKEDLKNMESKLDSKMSKKEFDTFLTFVYKPHVETMTGMLKEMLDSL